MTNDEFVAEIMTKSMLGLLGIIIENPEYLTDSYYRMFGNAIVKRYEQLRNEDGTNG